LITRMLNRDRVFFFCPSPTRRARCSSSDSPVDLEPVRLFMQHNPAGPSFPLEVNPPSTQESPGFFLSRGFFPARGPPNSFPLAHPRVNLVHFFPPSDHAFPRPAFFNTCFLLEGKKGDVSLFPPVLLPQDLRPHRCR